MGIKYKILKGIGLFFLKNYFAGGKCVVSRNLENKIILITGCNTGIGKETAKALIEKGGTIVMANRSFERTK